MSFWTDLLAMPISSWVPIAVSIVGAIASVGCILISNRSNLNRLKFQLQADSKTRREDKDREEKRREYKDAIAKLGKLMSIVSNSQGKTVSDLKKDLQEFQSLCFDLQIILLVADQNTTLKASETVSEISKLLLSTCKAAIDLDRFERKRSELNELFDETIERASKIADECKMATGQEAQRLGELHREELRRAKALMLETEKLNTTIFSHNMQETKDLFQHSLGVQIVAKDCIEAMRADAGIDRLHSKWLDDSLMKIQAGMVEQLKDFGSHVMKAVHEDKEEDSSKD